MYAKIIFSVLASIGTVAGFFPYLRDIFSLKTKPHVYTWLIWVITQGIAVVAMWYGGGGWGATTMTIGALFVFAVFLFSLRYGTKNITWVDTAILIIALCAIAVWVQFNQPVISVIMITAVDMLGYVPSFRKSYAEPWSETLSTWLIFSLSNFFVFLSLSEYNMLTLTYIVSITVANLLLCMFCVYRRKFVPKLPQ